MLNKKGLFGFFILLAGLGTVSLFAQMPKKVVDYPINNSFMAECNVCWTTLGKDENESMPLGNGDLAANVWTEQNGDLVLLLSKTDAWTEKGSIVKLGRIRVKLTPNPFVGSANFKQVLNLETSTIEIKSANNTLLVWIDANRPVLHVEAHFEKSTTLEAGLETWRKTKSFKDTAIVIDQQVMSGDASPRSDADVIFPATANRITWCHFNSGSCYPYVLKQEHLESVITKYADPLFYRCFGATLIGPGLVTIDDRTLKSSAPGQKLQLDIIALTQPKANSPKTWHSDMNALVGELNKISLKQARLEHEKWWQDFWNRSWIHVTGDENTAKVSQGYAIQRYMVAASSRGEIPPKFNGGVFTVGHDMPADSIKQSKTNHDPDYRAWGECYWNQNNRLLFWPLLSTGDYDLLKPWFNMYLKALPLATDRTQIYYRHEGAHFPETMYFWGLPRLGDFGKNNPTNEMQSHWQKYHIQGTLEVIAQMLDVNDHIPDHDFVRTSLIPFADAIVTYYDQHWQRDSLGKIKMSPTQSLETYQLVAVNPTPDIAGLMHVLPRMLALPKELISEKQRTVWAKILNDLPPIPMGTTAKGKLPPFGIGDPDGIKTILPAEKYGKPGNGENPELYVTFPYRLFGVGKPDLDLARNTFAARRSPQNTCWGQDGTQAAALGLTSVAQKAVLSEFTNYGDQRFLWFWKPAHDWIPDLDNGGDGMITLQSMLMQCDGKRIQLLPAWPKDWTADFKLHAPFQTTVEGHVENGKITNLKVIPQSRAKDIVVVPVP